MEKEKPVGLWVKVFTEIRQKAKAWSTMKKEPTFVLN